MSNAITSDNGRFLTVLQDDGNLVTYDGATSKPVWDAMSGIWRGYDASLPWPPPVPPEPPVTYLPPLTVDGHVFRAGGERFTVVMASDFNLLNRWQHGEDITPVLAQRRDAGFNAIRVWTLYDLEAANIGQFLDVDYSRIPEFVRTCASYGLYVELTAFTSLERHEHWARLAQACGKVPSGSVLLELGNELDLPVNHIDMGLYGQPFDVLCSHGSATSETDPPWDAWNYSAMHSNGASEEQRKVGKQSFDYNLIAGVPVICGETSRYPDVGMWAGSDLARQQQLAYDSARGAALLAAGSCWHSSAGKSSVLWDDTAFDVARYWTAGAKSVPLEVQHDDYRHRTDLESATIIRAYQRGPRDDAIALIRA